MFTDEAVTAMAETGHNTSSVKGRDRKQDLFYWLAVLALGLVGFFVGDSYVRHVLILALIWCLVAASWDMILGYAGIFNYAQLVFFAVGAYASAMISIQTGLPTLAALVVAGVVSAVIGGLIAIPCLRLRGEYVALFTFAVHLALPPVIQQGRSIGMGGTTGLLGIPPMNVFGYAIGPLDKLGWFLFALVVVSISVYAIYFWLLRSKFGHAFMALRDSEEFAQSLGVDERRYRLYAFVISAFFAGIAGAMYAHYTTVLTPKILGTEFFLMAMVMLAIGGMGRFPGAILGAFAVVIGNELLRVFDDYRLFILGVAIVVAVIFLPNGVISLKSRFLPSRR
jgi:branched-chain amino acid transport system permease protein